MSERGRDLAPYEPTDEEAEAFLAAISSLKPTTAESGEALTVAIRQSVARIAEARERAFSLPTEDEPQPWHRDPRGRIPEPWRKVGRAFDPSQRARSLGEQRQHAADRLLWGATGAAGALAALWLAWSVFVR